MAFRFKGCVKTTSCIPTFCDLSKTGLASKKYILTFRDLGKSSLANAKYVPTFNNLSQTSPVSAGCDSTF